MSSNIHKYTLGFGALSVRLHKDSVVLSAGYQPSGGLVVWIAEIPTTVEADRANFHLLPRFTGAAYPEGYSFVQTVQTPDGLVWHIFALKQKVETFL